MKNIFLCAFGVLLTSLSACKKDKFAPPEVQSVSIKANSPSSVTFVGNIIKTGNQTVKDYGFIYSVLASYVDENNGTKVSLGANPSKGEFSKTVDGINLSQVSYYGAIWARAYVTDENGTVFGAVVSTNLPRPTSSGIIPSSGQSGDIVKISGKFFNPNISALMVNFQGIRANVLTATDNEISVEVPRGIIASHGQSISVSISVGGASTNNNQYFTILANLKDFSPKSGPAGTYITFSGDNLPNSYSSYNYPIFFGNTQVYSNYYTQVAVPFTAEVSSEISVMINGQKRMLPGTFTITPPQITSFTPETVFPGQSITVTGSNFPPISDNSTGKPMAKVGSLDYTAVSVYNNQFSYSIPSNAPEGDQTLFFKVGPHEVQASKKIKVQGYTATSFSPTSGGPGREINITGNFIQGGGYYVTFGTVNSYGTATSPTNLRVMVPSGINAGKIKLAVDVPNKKITIPGDFEVTGPSFTSFSPASGVAGTLITIKGSGFFPNIYNTAVKFGTVSVTPTSVTENTIVVAVPSNVTPGAMKLSVVTYGQTVINNDNFTITN